MYINPQNKQEETLIYKFQSSMNKALENYAISLIDEYNPYKVERIMKELMKEKVK